MERRALRMARGFGIPLKYNTKLATSQRTKHNGAKKNHVAGFPGIVPRPVEVPLKARRGARAGGATPQSTPDAKRVKSQGEEDEDGLDNGADQEVPDGGGDETVESSGGIAGRVRRRHENA